MNDGACLYTIKQRKECFAQKKQANRIVEEKVGVDGIDKYSTSVFLEKILRY